MKFNVDDLIEQGLVKKKTYTTGIYKGLSVLKYTKKVFFKNLWHLDTRLLDCRGTVVDEDDNVIVSPFKKVFNLGESGTSVDPEREVVCPRKINGFMAAATYTEDYGLIVSTTGTLDSEYATLARKWIEKGKWERLWEGRTYLFEICDQSDPHIVEEDEGTYLIGMRFLQGDLTPEDCVDFESKFLGYKRPETFTCKFKDLDTNVEHEGFMVRDAKTGETLCKIKSGHYLISKFFARVGKRKLSSLFNGNFVYNFEEEYYPLYYFIKENYTKESWSQLHEQERLEVIRNFLNK